MGLLAQNRYVSDARSQGSYYPVTTELKVRIVAELKARGITKQDFALSIGCKPSSVNHLLGPAAKSSALVPKIFDFFGWGTPQLPLVSPDTEEIGAIFDRLDEAGRAELLDFARYRESKMAGNTNKK